MYFFIFSLLYKENKIKENLDNTYKVAWNICFVVGQHLQPYLDHCRRTGGTGWLSAFEEPGSTAGWSNTSTIFSHDTELIFVALSKVSDTVP